MDFTPQFQAKAEAAELPRSKWVSTALAAMGPVPRAHCQQFLERLVQEPNDMEWEAEWSHLLAALKSGPWAQQTTVHALRCDHIS